MSNFEDILHKRLILSRPLSKNEAQKLNIANTQFRRDEEENFLPKQWFCSIDIEGWGDVKYLYRRIWKSHMKSLLKWRGKYSTIYNKYSHVH